MPGVRVAVVGAGPSGLVTTKELLEAGHEPTCFERADGPGGVFRFDEREGVVWDSCVLTSSGTLTAFSDFPVEASEAAHMTTGQYVAYLQRYSAAFGVGERIRFGTTVESLTRLPDRGWNVRTHSGGEPRDERFDAVAVCSGLHQHPHRPRFPGEEGFPGLILHSSAYRRPDELAGRRVVVVGCGETGADLAAEAAEHAADTILSLRRGVAVLPRIRRGRPNDYRTARINNSAAPWIFQTRHPDDAWKRRLYIAAFFPLVAVDKIVQSAFQLLERAGDLRPLLRGRLRETREAIAARRITRELLAESGGTLHEQFATKSEAFVQALATGRCRRVGTLERFEGPRAVFADGASCEPDVVILCTGYETIVPVLAGEIADAPRFLHTFDPAAGPSLAFVGFARPGLGAIPPIGELQARWFAALLSGSVELPPAETMAGSIVHHTERRRATFRAVRGRLEHLVDFTLFCDELASQIGCLPTQAALRRESRRFRRRFFGAPFVAAQYRLVGPGAKPELARAVIESLPLGYGARELATFHVRFALSRAMYRLLGPKFAPKLVLP